LTARIWPASVHRSGAY